MGKTGRGKKDHKDGAEQKLYLQSPLLELRVSESELNFLTSLPDGLDSSEWIATHTIGFFEHINLIYGTISEFCTPSSCPEMTGPGPRQYLWLDDKGKKSKLSGPQYIDYIMTYAQKTINDESIFPTKHGKEFPSTFDTQIKKLHRLFFHVIAHIYHAHFKEIVLLQLHAHLNALFAHFVEFNVRFHTVEEKEMEVLDDLIIALRLAPPKDEDQIGGSSSAAAAASVTTSTAQPGSEAATGDSDNPKFSEENKENIMEEVICRQPTNSVDFPMPEQAAATATASDVAMTDAENPSESAENCVEMTEATAD